MQDPFFGKTLPDLQELRAAIDHAPRLVDHFLRLYRSHRTTLDKLMRQGGERMPQDLLASSPEAIIHDFFRNHRNHFPDLEAAAEALRAAEPCEADDVYAVLKSRLAREHGIAVTIRPVEEMERALRVHDRAASVIRLSEALDHQNRAFQLAHVLCLIELPALLQRLTAGSGIQLGERHRALPGRARQLFRRCLPDAICAAARGGRGHAL